MCRHSLGTSQSNLRTNAVEVALPPVVMEHETPWKPAPPCEESRAVSYDRIKNHAER